MDGSAASTTEGPGTCQATKKRVLVVCATRYGSTLEVAQAVAEELRNKGADAEVFPAPEAPGPGGYDAVVVGGPMIMGWHKQALRYLRKYQQELSKIPTAYFITAASLTETGEASVEGVPVMKDQYLAMPPKKTGSLTRRERFTLPAKYLKKPLRQAPAVRPVSVAFFAGSLDLTKMNLFEVLFVLLIVGASPGDRRNWDTIRDWARGLPPALRL
jgi:menaquinone-dependent protoporphyrinogen oxidase